MFGYCESCEVCTLSSPYRSTTSIPSIKFILAFAAMRILPITFLVTLIASEVLAIITKTHAGNLRDKANQDTAPMAIRTRNEMVDERVLKINSEIRNKLKTSGDAIENKIQLEDQAFWERYLSMSMPGSSEESMRGRPYCEIQPIIVNQDQSITQVVFSTWGFNYCPPEQFATITVQNVIDAYYAAYGVNASKASLVPLRYWTIDDASAILFDPRPLLTVNGIESGYLATLTFPAGESQCEEPYCPNTVNRNTTYTFLKNKLVYELINPTGEVFMMQSYTTQYDSELNLKNFSSPNFEEELTLPSGWNYRARLLKDNFYLVANGTTQLIRDIFGSSYQLSPTTKV